MSEQPPYPQGQPPGQGQPPYPQGQPPGQGQPPYQPGYPPYPGQPWQQPAAVGPAPGVEFAGHGARLGAYILDAIIVGFVMSVLFLVVAIPLFGATLSGLDWDSLRRGDLTAEQTWDIVRPALALIPLGLLIGLIGLLYFPFFWARGGQTPGMRVAGIRVVRDRDGGDIGWGTAFMRLIGYWVSSAVLSLGFIWILIDSRRRGWHDLLAGTCVISAR